VTIRAALKQVTTNTSSQVISDDEQEVSPVTSDNGRESITGDGRRWKNQKHHGSSLEGLIPMTPKGSAYGARKLDPIALFGLYSLLDWTTLVF
jgi:hypothetical protein